MFEEALARALELVRSVGMNPNSTYYYMAYSELEKDTNGSFRAEFYKLVTQGHTVMKCLSKTDGLEYACIDDGLTCYLRSPTHEFYRVRAMNVSDHFSKRY